MLNVICAIICLMCKRRDDIFSWKAGDAKGDSGWIVAWFFQIFSTTQNMFRNLPGRASSVYLGLTFVLIYALEWCSLFEILELGVSRASRGVNITSHLVFGKPTWNNSAFFKTLLKKPVTPSPSLCFEHLCCLFQLKIKSEKCRNCAHFLGWVPHWTLREHISWPLILSGSELKAVPKCTFDKAMASLCRLSSACMGQFSHFSWMCWYTAPWNSCSKTISAH